MDEVDAWLVDPTPGYVVKFKDVSHSLCGPSGKLMLNVCHCAQLPSPVDDLDEDELAKDLDAGKPGPRIPLVVSDPESVLDNQNEAAAKMDVLCNSVFFGKRLAPQAAHFYRRFFLNVVCQLLQDRYNLELDPAKSVQLKNKKHVGDIRQQRVAKRAPRQTNAVAVEKASHPPSTSSSSLNDGPTPYDDVIESANVRLELVNGTHFEATVTLDSAVENPSDLRVRISSWRLLVMFRSRKTIADIHWPMRIDVDSVETRFLISPKQLVVRAPAIALSGQ